MDFSYAGYMGGGVAIPDVAVKETVQASGGADDAAAIQGAIDRVSKLPMVGGFRGAVLLGPGTFNSATTISIAASGVTLRGSGCGPSGSVTTINLVERPHLAISVRAAGGRRRAEVVDDAPAADAAAGEASLAQTVIADAYVPSGAMSFKVADAGKFAVGDDIAIRRPVTEAWVKFMGMDDLVRDGKPQTWIREGGAVSTFRRIAGISGNAITLDVPLSDSFDAKYLNPPGTMVAKIKPSAELSQIGVESIHILCPPQQINHTEQHFVAIRMDGQDCWIRDMVIDETMDSVGVNGRRITVQRVAVNRKVPHVGSSKPAEFAPNGGQVLLDRCSVNADNVWFSATGAEQAGPMVLLNCTFLGSSEAESHQRWSTGILYDNCTAPQGGITLRDRGSMGSGHGWTMGWGVVWNCRTKNYIIQNPPGAVNWLIGCVGENELAPQPFGSGPNMAAGTIDSPQVAVAPQSLYLAQLKQRLGAGALRNIGY